MELVARTVMLNRLSVKALTIAILLAASLNLAGQVYRMHRESVERQEMFERTGFVWCYWGPSLDERARFFVEVLLIVALIGSRLKSFRSFLLSFVTLSAVVAIYVLWWREYLLLAEISESEARHIPQFAYLVGGNFLDVCIAAWIACLILLRSRLAVLLVIRSIRQAVNRWRVSLPNNLDSILLKQSRAGRIPPHDSRPRSGRYRPHAWMK
jgi:hypothetical protein